MGEKGKRVIQLTDDEWKLVIRAIIGYDGYDSTDEELDHLFTIAELMRKELNK